jgi:hypothetical protein
MANSNVATGAAPGTTRVIAEASAGHLQPSLSAVSWGAIFAGAAAAAALSLILLVLGVGLGLSSVSPWADSGVSATTFGISTILWLTFTQLAASGTGGYLAGRLRTRWINTMTDEIYFRDTAHGFLAWAMATLVTAALLTSVIGSIVSGSAKAGASMVSGIAATAATATAGGAAAIHAEKTSTSGNDGSLDYFVDSLFRQAPNTAKASPPRPGNATAAPSAAANNKTPPDTAEVSRIMTNAIHAGAIPSEDARYVGQLISQHTGMTQQEAEKRVEETYGRAQTKLKEIESASKDAADKARKASAYSALWFFISLLIGAFVASLTATWGGRHRDI